MSRRPVRPEAQVVGDVLLQVGSRPDVRLWRNNTGAGVTGTGRVVRFGHAGQGDLSGVLRLHCGVGVRLEVEIKRPDLPGQRAGKQRPEQVAFQRVMERFGALYILATTVAEVHDALDAYLERHRQEHERAVAEARAAMQAEIDGLRAYADAQRQEIERLRARVDSGPAAAAPAGTSGARG